MRYLKRRINGNNIIIISIFSLMLIISSFGIMMTVDFAYGQASQVNPNSNNTDTNSLDIQNIPPKKFTLEA